MKCILKLILSLIFLFLISSCSKVDCAGELGLVPSLGCKADIGKTKDWQIADRVIYVTRYNYRGFTHYNHKHLTPDAKRCAMNYYKKSEVSSCDKVIQKLDKYCFEKKSIYACQYIYDYQSTVTKNTDYINKVNNFMRKNNLYIASEIKSFFPDVVKTENGFKIFVSYYPFLVIDKDINGIINVNEIKYFYEKILKIIKSNNNSLSKKIDNKLIYSGIFGSQIPFVHNIIKLCSSSQTAPLSHVDINNCGVISSKLKNKLVQSTLTNKNSLGITELLISNYVYSIKKNYNPRVGYTHSQSVKDLLYNHPNDFLR